MALMLLDHTREFFFGETPNPTDLAQTNLALFMTRWMTHFCAPVFVFLAGTSAYIYGSKRKPAELSKFLLSRGIWLVFLEMTIIRWGWSLYDVPLFYFQVIWALGFSMILLGLWIHLGVRGVLASGLFITLAHDGLTPILLESTSGLTHVIVQFLLGKKEFLWNERSWIVLYAILPWFGVMCLGYAFGHFFTIRNWDERKKLCVRWGLSAISLFVILRALNLYGDPNQWAQYESTSKTFMSFINVAKYPPSLQYLCITLGFSLLSLPSLERLGFYKLGQAALTLGRVPMMFYIIHLYVLSAMGLILSWIQEIPFVVGQGLNVSLSFTWGVWIFVLLSLYPFCKWYAKYKKNHNYWWLSYL